MKDMPTFLEEELHEPFHTWKADPNPDNTAAYLKAIDPILSTALKSYAGGQSSSTLKSHAKLMALDASKRYDPSRAKLRTHLMTQLQPLRRTAIQSTQPVHLPEKVSLHLYRLHHAEN